MHCKMVDIYQLHFKKGVVRMVKLRVSGTPKEIHEFDKIISLVENFFIKRKSKEYKRKYRYKDEISIYFDIDIPE